LKPTLKNLSEQVMVITGATSGIGLTTARAAVRRGAKVVLAARNEAALKELEKELGGSQALGIVADVTNLEDVRNLARAAVQRFGRIDTWVNNAGGSIYGKVVDVPVEDERKLFELNYWGYVYGSRVAVEHMRQSGGALINVGSVASDRGIPLQSSYCATKHAVKAFTETLRAELEKDGIPISVSLIKPTAIDTPFFQHAKTYMHSQPVEPSPMYAPETVAKAILYCAENRVRDLPVGGLAPLQIAMGRLFPRLGDKFVERTMFEGQQENRRPGPDDNQILERPGRDLRQRGRYDDVKVLERSTYTEAMMHPVLTGAVAVGAGAALALLLGARRS
jgi:short-subunit dehydrogenase